MQDHLYRLYRLLQLGRRGSDHQLNFVEHRNTIFVLVTLDRLLDWEKDSLHCKLPWTDCWIGKWTIYIVGCLGQTAGMGNGQSTLQVALDRLRNWGMDSKYFKLPWTDCLIGKWDSQFCTVGYLPQTARLEHGTVNTVL